MQISLHIFTIDKAFSYIWFWNNHAVKLRTFMLLNSSLKYNLWSIYILYKDWQIPIPIKGSWFFMSRYNNGNNSFRFKIIISFYSVYFSICISVCIYIYILYLCMYVFGKIIRARRPNVCCKKVSSIYSREAQCLKSWIMTPVDIPVLMEETSQGPIPTWKLQAINDCEERENQPSLVMSSLFQYKVVNNKHAYTNATLIVTQQILLLMHTCTPPKNMTVIIQETEAMYLWEDWVRGGQRDIGGARGSGKWCKNSKHMKLKITSFGILVFGSMNKQYTD